MNIDTNTIATMTEANQNFSRVAKKADQYGEAIIFKNNRPKYRLRVSMRVARGSASLLPSHGRGLWPRDVLKKVSRGLSRVEAGNPGFPRLVQVTSGGFSWWL